MLDISCDQLQCKKLNSNIDIYSEIAVGNSVYERYGSGYNRWSSWRGGFLYTRDAGEIDATISGLPKNSQQKMSVFLNKKDINGVTYIGVCPTNQCIQ